jgi:peptidyl-prolyl cis-trans isomerase C
METATTRPPLPLPVISVNGTAISRDAIARETQHHPAENSAAAWKQAARALVIRELLLGRAQSLKLEPAPLAGGEGRRETDDEALIRQVVEVEVKLPVTDEATCRRYFDQNRKRFRSPDIFEAEHILISASPEDENAREQAEEEAKKINAAVLAAPHLFADFAKTCSACPSAKEGGNLGQITRGATAPEFEKVLMALEPGEISKYPCETRYGFHIIKLTRRTLGQDLPFEAVHDHIASYLAEAVERRALSQYISILAESAAITGIEL